MEVRMTTLELIPRIISKFIVNAYIVNVNQVDTTIRSSFLSWSDLQRIIMEIVVIEKKYNFTPIIEDVYPVRRILTKIFSQVEQQ